MKKRKVLKYKDLTPAEQAIMSLARHIERCPYNEYNVEHEVANMLGLEKVNPSHLPLVED